MVADPIISMVRPLENKVVVDLGIGTGSLAFRAMELSRPKKMIGIDFSKAGLCVARNISRHSKFVDMDFEGVIADLERLRWPANRSTSCSARPPSTCSRTRSLL